MIERNARFSKSEGTQVVHYHACTSQNLIQLGPDITLLDRVNKIESSLSTNQFRHLASLGESSQLHSSSIMRDQAEDSLESQTDRLPKDKI
jgi:hypothetical protein